MKATRMMSPLAALAAVALLANGTPAFAKGPKERPARSNQGGKLRGRDRAKQVHEMNEARKAEKKADGQPTTPPAPGGQPAPAPTEGAH